MTTAVRCGPSSTGRSPPSATRWPTSATSLRRGQSRASTTHPSALPRRRGGFPSRAEILERYAARSGRDVSGIDFYVSFAAWKSACIYEGVYARYGNGGLDTTGVDVDGRRIAVERYAAMAARLTHTPR